MCKKVIIIIVVGDDNNSSWWGANKGDEFGQREERKIKDPPLPYLLYTSLLFPFTASAWGSFSSILLSHCLQIRSLCILLLTANGENKHPECSAQQLAVLLLSKAFSVMLSIPERQDSKATIISIIHLSLHIVEVYNAEVRVLTVEEQFICIVTVRNVPVAFPPSSYIFTL